MRYKLACIALLFLSVFSAAAATLKIDAAHPGAAISPTMWGIFFEDVNFAADGGLYAEMVKNRSFEFPDPMMGWTRIGDGQLSIQEKNPLSSNERHYLRVHSIGPVPTGVSNEGFRGMGISQDERYDFSAEIRRVSGAPELGGATGGRRRRRPGLSAVEGILRRLEALRRCASAQSERMESAPECSFDRRWDAGLGQDFALS